MHNPTPYPAGAFYVAHQLFTGPNFRKGGEWGDVMDGPVTDLAEALEQVVDRFDDELAAGEMPTRENLRMWLITPGEAPVDCTETALAELAKWVKDEEAA